MVISSKLSPLKRWPSFNIRIISKFKDGTTVYFKTPSGHSSFQYQFKEDGFNSLIDDAYISIQFKIENVLCNSITVMLAIESILLCWKSIAICRAEIKLFFFFFFNRIIPKTRCRSTALYEKNLYFSLLLLCLYFLHKQ